MKEIIFIILLLPVVYGWIALPYLANRSIKHLAEDEKSNFPVGAEVFEEEILVNDVLSGGHTLV